MSLREEDFVIAAEELGCEVAAIKAVAQVEAAGPGFLSNGLPKILFESHKFSQFTDGKYDVTHTRLSTKEWKPSLYLGGQLEHKRLQMATALDRDAALRATSWGKFQILGDNWKACGFASLQDFVNGMYKDETEHLKAFVGFVKSQGLTSALQKRNWKLFARKYNGPAYWRNNYDVKLENAYKKYIH